MTVDDDFGDDDLASGGESAVCWVLHDTESGDEEEIWDVDGGVPCVECDGEGISECFCEGCGC